MIGSQFKSFNCTFYCYDSSFSQNDLQRDSTFHLRIDPKSSLHTHARQTGSRLPPPLLHCLHRPLAPCFVRRSSLNAIPRLRRCRRSAQTMLCCRSHLHPPRHHHHCRRPRNYFTSVNIWQNRRFKCLKNHKNKSVPHSPTVSIDDRHPNPIHRSAYG